MLFNPEAFEALTDEPWDEDRARAAIRTVVNDADAAFDPDGLWPANEWDAWRSTPPLKDLYVGAAGVAWALDALRRRDFAETRLDLAAAAGSALELWAEAPDLAAADLPLPRPSEPSLLCGEGGILLVAWRLSPREELADRLLARVRENVANEAEELMWGAPGTMLAAHAMHGWTGEERWAKAWRGSAEALHARRDADGLWTQRLYGGPPTRILGPVHGLVGNVHALLQREDPRNDALRADTAALLAREAVVEDGLANWPAVPGEGLERNHQVRVQWCHGAPPSARSSEREPRAAAGSPSSRATSASPLCSGVSRRRPAIPRRGDLGLAVSASAPRLSAPPEGIRAGALVLRFPVVDDVDALLPAFADPELREAGNLPAFGRDELAASLADLPRLAEAGRLMPLAAVEAPSGKVVGASILHHLDVERRMVEIGYFVLPAARRRGFSTTIARTLAEHAFSLGVERVAAYVNVDNAASERVLERAGSTREGVVRAMPKPDGHRVDKTLFSLLPRDLLIPQPGA